MTTLVGIVARKGTPGVVLASDVISTTDSWEDRGDVSYRKQEQQEYRKIHVNKAGDLAVAVAGLVGDRPYLEFMYELLNGEIDFKAAVALSHFKELEKLNLTRAGGKVLPNDRVNGLMVATRFGGEEPSLYSCWPLGHIEQISPGTAIGSGSNYAMDYLRDEIGSNLAREISIEAAVDHAREAIVKRAAKDIYTKGIDMAIVRPDGIRQYGARIKEAVDRVLDTEFEAIKKENAG